MNDPYIRRAQLIRVIDGDTLRLRIDLGWNAYSEHNVRLLRVNTPELRKDDPAGDIAKGRVTMWLKDHDTGWPLTIRSEKSDSFGRYLVEVFDVAGECLNDYLVGLGYAAD